VRSIETFNLLMSAHSTRLLCFESVPYLCGNLLQCFSLRFPRITRREFKPEPVAFIAWKDVQMDVENFLHGCLAIRQKEIDAFTLHAALTQRRGETPCDAEHLRAFFLFQVGEMSGVSVRDDEQVTGINRLDVHEGGTNFIPVNKAGFRLACQDFTEDTIFPVSHNSSRSATERILSAVATAIKQDKVKRDD
jgi:hypothetical protein